MTFEETVSGIHEGGVITFREYTLDRHEHRKRTLNIEYGVVQQVIPANQPIPRETIEQLYGEDLDVMAYLQLSMVNAPRIVVNVNSPGMGEPLVKVITLSKYFFDVGLQEVDLIDTTVDLTEPNYLLAQKGW